MRIGLTFTHFQLSWKDPDFNASFTHTVTVFKTISPFLKKQVGISPKEGLINVFKVFKCLDHL